MAGRNRDSKKPRGKKPLSNGWIVVPSKTYKDRVYFYNTVTKCSTWNNPCEDSSDEEFSSPEKTSPQKQYSLRTRQKTVTSHSKKQKNDVILNSKDTNSNIRINSEIEDYDDQDAYFSENHISAFSGTHSHIASPPSSPDSVSSFRTNISDADNLLLESNKKQLWTHFISSPDKVKVKKSLALSDFYEASTSRNSEMEKNAESDSNNVNGFLKNRRKKKKKQTEKKKSALDKVNKNMSFKSTDKTPAQTRLLKLRKQNAQKLKELAAKYPEFGIEVDGDSKKLKNNSSIIIDSEVKTGNTAFNGALQSVFNSVEQGTSYNSSLDFSEEMDWEPSSEESDVRNINEFRQQVDKPYSASSCNFFDLNSGHTSVLPSKTNSWVLVFDTNIFVSCLPFVKELRDTKVIDLGYPVIYVPWRVLQELDHLKNTKLDSVNKNLLMNVRRAIAYLNDNFKSRHPRIFGQSFSEFERIMDFNASDFAPDDEILQTCIQLQKQHGDIKLMLLTNDKNLESKAIVSGVEVYSKERFQKKYLKSDSLSLQLNNSALNKSNIGGADDCLCQVKVILKDFLTMVVETEMSVAFEGDWIKVVAKKPPWSLQDVMKCLLKHWRAVFFLSFSRDTQSVVGLLNQQLFNREAVTSDDVAEIIRTVQRLMICIKKSQKKKRPYLDVIPATMTKLNDLLRILLPDQPDTQASSLPSVPGTSFNPQEVSQMESSSSFTSKAKILFKEIWDSLRNFCCSISDIIHSSGPNTEAIVLEMRAKLSQVLNEVGELVATIERILEINPSEISEHHPVIIHFSNFLLLVYPNMVPHLKNELPRCLASFFTDFEGRSLITISLKDFKEFIQDLAKAAEYFSAQYMC